MNYLNRLKDKSLYWFTNYWITFMKWMVSAVVIGLVGAAGRLFHECSAWRGTNLVFESVTKETGVPFRVAPLLFAGTLLTPMGGSG